MVYGNGGNGGDGGVPGDDNVAASNAASRQYDWRPRPDPTVLTTQQLRSTEEALNQTIRERLAGLRELLEARLSGMDEATRLLSRRMQEVGDQLDQRSMGRHDTLQELVGQRLDSMDLAAKLLAAQVEKIPSDAAIARDRVRDEFAAADQSLRELLGARIDGMDQATKLLAVTMDKVPSDIDRAIAGLREVLRGEIARVSSVTLEKFSAVDALFASNATALTAALAAQEKAVAEQNKSNTLAIDKSEQATKETIAANANQTSTGIAGLGTVMDDLKSRVVRLEGLIQSARVASEDSLAVGTYSQTAETNRASAEVARAAQSRAVVALAISGILVLVSLSSVLFAVLKK